MSRFRLQAHQLFSSIATDNRTRRGTGTAFSTGMIRTLLDPAQTAGAFCTLLLTAAPLHAQASGEGPQPRIEELSFRGVEHVDEGEIRGSIITEATDCKSPVFTPICWITTSGTFVERHYLDPLELERDELRIRVFYLLRGYRETEVTSEVVPAGDGVAVTFAVEEGHPTLTRSVAVIQTDTVLDAVAVAEADLPAEDEPLSLIQLDSAQARLLDMLHERGYADAEVRDTVRVAADLRGAAVEIIMEPGRITTIDEIVIRGNEAVSDRTIRRSLTFEPGDVFHREELFESRRQLFGSNLFRQALISVSPPADSAKRVEVTVREAPFREMRAGFGFNTVDFVQASAGFTRYNWFGGARRLDLRTAVGNLFAPRLNGVGFFYPHDVAAFGSADGGNPYLDPTWEVGAEFTQPWFLSAGNSLGLGVFAQRRTVPGIVIDRGYGANASFTRRLAEGVPLSAEYRFEVTTVEAGDVYFCVNYGVCGRPTINALRGSQRLSPFSIRLLADQLNDPLTPTAGYTARLDVEHASTFTASDFRYNRISGEVTRLLEAGPGVLAGRVRGGWVRPLESTAEAVGALTGQDGIIHPRKRFYAGGSQSVRGYGENQLGPRILTIAPEALDSVGGVDACTAPSPAGDACDLGEIDSGFFLPRPLGGTSLVEANIEYRFPVWGPLNGAVFVDAATVGAGGSDFLADRTSAVTPGFGLRITSPIGPIRLDLGIKPTIEEELRVVTEDIVDGERRIVELRPAKLYDPVEDAGGGIIGFFQQAINRLTLHLSIGQPF